MSEEKTTGLSISGDNLKNLEKVAKDLDKARGSDAAAKSAAKLNPCAEYKKIKPILKTALPFIRLLPKFGKQVADAIELLMGIADNFCP